MRKYLLIPVIAFLMSCNKTSQKQEQKNDSLVTFTFNKVISDNARVELQNHFKISSNDIVFLGDSQTEGFPTQEMFNNLNVKNRGIAGNTTFNVLERMSNITKGKPKKIFLEIGLNDIANNTEVNKVFSNFKLIYINIENQSPNTVLYVQSVLPTSKDNKGLNPKIVTYNNLLKKFCKENDIVFIDLYSHYLNVDVMNDKYSFDGTHLNVAGYELWKSLINQYVN